MGFWSPLRVSFDRFLTQDTTSSEIATATFSISMAPQKHKMKVATGGKKMSMMGFLIFVGRCWTSKFVPSFVGVKIRTDIFGFLNWWSFVLASFFICSWKGPPIQETKHISGWSRSRWSSENLDKRFLFSLELDHKKVATKPVWFETKLRWPNPFGLRRSCGEDAGRIWFH